MKDGSIVIQIEPREDLKERLLEKLESALNRSKIKFKSFRVENNQLIAPIISSSSNDDYETGEVFELHVPFYKLTKVKTPDEKEAKKLLEQQLEEELEISVMLQREQGLTTAEIDKMSVQELLEAKRKKDQLLKEK